MEDVLDLYAAPYDPARPVVCLDERPVVLRADVLRPPPGAWTAAAAGQRGRPLRHRLSRRWPSNRSAASATSSPACAAPGATSPGWLKELVDVHYPAAETIRLVLDNLNTHIPAALYETFPPAEARRLVRKLELHYTPKHGSWLNMAEIELSVLASHAWTGASPTWPLSAETAAYADRNADQATVHWRFTTPDAAPSSLISTLPSSVIITVVRY